MPAVVRPAGLRAAVLALALVGCAQAVAPAAAPRSRPPAPAAGEPSLTPSPAPGARHVFVVVLENTKYERAMAQPNASSLASRFALATAYHAVGHPSLPNYLALTSGDTFDIHDDSYRALPGTGLGVQLDAAGESWRAYFEGMDGGCFAGRYPYALHHNPFAFYGGACPAQAVSFAPLDADLALPAAQAPRLFWITPGLCHDGHDCGPGAADTFLGTLAGRVMASPSWRANGVLLVTWDEDDGSAGNHVPLLVITPSLRGRVIEGALDHYSLLATLEDLLGVGRLGAAQRARSLKDLLATPS